jgi:ArsR family transcriptional regulator, arsenate/arsenite/antimonite-responsive transcriptional repressor
MALGQTTDMLQALADPLRIMIMRLLLERELCVGELVEVLEEPQYKVSRHLAILRNAGFLRDWREGAWIHYEVAPNLNKAWQESLEKLKEVWDEETEIQTALWRLRKKTTRDPGKSVFSSVS